MFEIIGLIIGGIGMILSLIGSLWFLVVAFRKSILWGLGCILLPFVSLIFLLFNLDEAIKPFGLSLGGIILALIGFSMLPGEGVIAE